MTYQKFLDEKLKFQNRSGFECENLNKMLFDFQKDIVRWALRCGKAAIFAECGMGKTPMQLEWANQVYNHINKDVLILAPLAVSKQTKREGEKFGINVTICESQDDVKSGVNITNYEKLHKFNSDHFGGIVLDESSILKSFSGKYKKLIIDSFERTPYKLACTATPAPNDFIELGNHSDFLNIMSQKEMLSMFFINDTANTGTWRLKGHAEEKFWEWVCSWAVMIKQPSDLGYDDGKFILPSLNIVEKKVDNDQKPMDGFLFAFEAQTLSERRQARKSSVDEKISVISEIVNNSDEQWLVWCDLNDESKKLSQAINDSVEITGSDSSQHKENSMLSFSDRDIKCVVSKPSICGWGMNWQNCHNMIFIGLSDSYEAFYQAVRRCWRFGQEKEVNVYIMTSTLEGAVLKNIKRKEKEAKRMSDQMVKNMEHITKKNIRGFSACTDIHNVEKIESDDYILFNGDCVEVIKNIDSNSIHYSLFSPPFAALFTYSNSIRDMGNCKDKNEFLEHFKFLAGELYRVIMPGRLLSFHVMNLPSTITSDGYIGLKDFRGDLIRIFQDAGFVYYSEVCIWKDPLVQATRTKTLTLAHKQISKDSARCAQGLPDYIVTMRKLGDNPEPVAKGRGFEKYVGDMDEPKRPKNDNPAVNKYSHEVWQRYASPVWFDINQTRTLNARQARDHRDEKHMCPLQLDTIERCYELWTNPGDTILSPFAGIGSEGFCAIKANRKFIGIELKRSYFDECVRNIQNADREAKEGQLF